MEMSIRSAASKADVADILNHYDLSDDDLLAGFPHLAKSVQELPDASPTDS